MRYFFLVLAVCLVPLGLFAAAVPGRASPGSPQGASIESMHFDEALWRIGSRLGIYFTYEADERSHPVALSTAELADPKSVEKIDQVVPFLKAQIAGIDIERDTDNPRIFHIVDKRLHSDKKYPLSSRLSLDFNGTPSDLVAKLSGALGGRVAQAMSGALGEPMFDYRSHVNVTAKNQTARGILSDYLPLKGYGPLLWRVSYQNTRHGDVAYVYFLQVGVHPSSSKPATQPDSTTQPGAPD